MNDPLTIALSAFAGLFLGTVFFGGLWWTIRMGVASGNPALWFFCSLMIRMAAVFAGLYWIGKDDWKRLVACLFGLIVARFAVTWLTRQSGGIAKEESHAS